MQDSSFQVPDLRFLDCRLPCTPKLKEKEKPNPSDPETYSSANEEERFSLSSSSTMISTDRANVLKSTHERVLVPGPGACVNCNSVEHYVIRKISISLFYRVANKR